ncbi:MAG: phosphoribosylformimino-5-aminoimidazole carboxamide ribotide isomerase [Lachnospiraceae bacterium]|nr:phosphoribosylformimino-5-aminoimidazole carboxamide ribotide isomerase [Lachnospiraceae bacterium]
MRFRPCIDIHNGKVKQIVGGSLRDEGDQARENFVANQSAADYARLYGKDGLNGGHIILLNPQTSDYYEETKRQALAALTAAPGCWQIGGGIRTENAEGFLQAGATHVIVTSYVFRDGQIDYKNLDALVRAVGKEHLVLDLSCRKRGANYFIVTDRWQKFTDVKLTGEVLKELAASCDEFLVHAADVEGKSQGIEQEVVRMLGDFAGCPVTYAGGVGSYADVEQLRTLGKGHVDVTVGSALDLFGGPLSYKKILKLCEK